MRVQLLNSQRQALGGPELGKELLVETCQERSTFDDDHCFFNLVSYNRLSFSVGITYFLSLFV